jgi:ubiquinone/menaquinone biosynthesis C-methylase UbiE
MNIFSFMMAGLPYIDYCLDYIKALINSSGPDPNDYDDLNAWIEELRIRRLSGEVQVESLALLFECLDPILSLQSMQGFAFHKPHGYAGDFEMIDRIYSRYISSDQFLAKWDIFMQAQPASQAVRNRVGYFSDQINTRLSTKFTPESPIKILNLASGPGRDMQTFFKQTSIDKRRISIDCVEQDENAIHFAQEVCSDYTSSIKFIQANALRFSNGLKYDLIWSAGLFDYFNDKVFVFMLKRLKGMLDSGGEIIIGNFSTMNPSRSYMELMEWYLHHRSPHTLKSLATAAGFIESSLSVKRESTGVNLFLHALI